MDILLGILFCLIFLVLFLLAILLCACVFKTFFQGPRGLLKAIFAGVLALFLFD